MFWCVSGTVIGTRATKTNESNCIGTRKTSQKSDKYWVGPKSPYGFPVK